MLLVFVACWMQRRRKYSRKHSSQFSKPKFTTETVDTTATSEAISKEEQERKAALEESERKFKSAENYQEGGEYFKAYSLYQKVIEDDSNYTEAQKRATEMLDLYWKQQDALVEQGEYQTAIENTASAMSFMGLTSLIG